MSAEGTPRKDAPNPDATTPRLPSIPGSIAEEIEEDDGGSPDTIKQGSISRRDYGTIDTEGTVRHRPQPRSTSPGSFQPLSPQTTRAKKPPTLRRTTTRNKSLPYRGEQFSVDDDPSEVEEERVEWPTLKRQTSLVRRRTQTQVPTLSRAPTRADQMPTLSRVPTRADTRLETREEPQEEPSEPEESPEQFEEMDDDDEAADGDDDDALSDAESFTLKDRQLAINETHPFGIRIWKPALYKKNRSVEKNAEDDIHSSPSAIVSRWLWIINALWTILFGWWLALATVICSLVCFLFVFEPSAVEYGKVFWGLAGYLFWPFGKFVKLEQDEQYAEEDEGEGRSISEYERWQSGDLEYGRLMFGPSFGHTGSIVGRHRNSVDSTSERDSLLGRTVTRLEQRETGGSTGKRRLFGRGSWTLGRVVFFGFFYFLITPLMLFVSLLCWFLVFSIPMGRVLLILFYHLRKRPLSLSFHPDVSYVRDTTKPSSILLCTYRAAGLKYWKYTVDGTNIFLINFLMVVVFVIVDYYGLKKGLGWDIWLTSPALLFTMALVSIIPLAYFIGQAVASISAQSTMGVGAAVNAFFSTIVEVYLYCIALNEGKGKLVEGSIIGSIFAGILLLPGLSMCFGAIKRKTQRFNVKSAGATTTMLLFAIIATFGPTLFYKIYGAHELICKTCGPDRSDEERDCRQCYFRQVPAISDSFFIQAVRPYCWIAAVFLFLSYLVGLMFTLRTHAAVIWSTEIDEKKAQQPQTAEVSPMDTRAQSTSASQVLPAMNGHPVSRSNVRESQLYKRILGQSLQSAGYQPEAADDTQTPNREDNGVDTADQQLKSSLPHVVPPKSSGQDAPKDRRPSLNIPGLTEEQHSNLVHQVAEMAATAATIATRDAVQHPRAASYLATHSIKHDSPRQRRPSALRVSTLGEEPQSRGGADSATHATPGAHGEEAPGGHDAPNWSRMKSSIILLTATLAYAIIAEVLVDTVDVVLSAVDIDEKFLGITLFALVPNTTEFLNAISFAMNGNIALSMEIGSAYALQVCMLQIPALVLFSAVHGQFIDPGDLIDHTFNLIFPQFDMVTVILCVFLLSYVYGEGKSNYFKGSILVFTYLVVLAGFYFSGYTGLEEVGIDMTNTLAIRGNGPMRMHSNPGSFGTTQRVEL